MKFWNSCPLFTFKLPENGIRLSDSSVTWSRSLWRGASGLRCWETQILVCWQTRFPNDRHRFGFLAGACSGFFSSSTGRGYTDKYNKKSPRREARPNPLYPGRDPWLLILPKGQLCRNVLFAFLLSVNICTSSEGASPVK